MSDNLKEEINNIQTLDEAVPYLQKVPISAIKLFLSKSIKYGYFDAPSNNTNDDEESDSVHSTADILPNNENDEDDDKDDLSDLEDRDNQKTMSMDEHTARFKQIETFLEEFQNNVLVHAFVHSCFDSNSKKIYPMDVVKLCQQYWKNKAPIILTKDVQILNMDNSQLNTACIWKTNKNGEPSMKINILMRYCWDNFKPKIQIINNIEEIGNIPINWDLRQEWLNGEYIIKRPSYQKWKLQLTQWTNINHQNHITNPLKQLNYVEFLSCYQVKLLVNGYISGISKAVNINLGIDILKIFQLYVNNYNQTNDIVNECAELIKACFNGNYNNAKQILKQNIFKKKQDMFTDCYKKRYFKVGDRVKLARGKTGIVKFIGETDFAKGEVIGLELDRWTPAGMDGMVRGKRYFYAANGRGYFTRRSSISEVITPEKLEQMKQALKIGDTVLVTNHGTGTVKYIGPVHGNKYKNHKMVGVALEASSGIDTNNGQLNGVIYFDVPDGYGVFVKMDEILYIDQLIIDEINVQYYKGNTVLHIATQCGYNDIVALLIQNGIDVDIANENGETALFNGVRIGDRAIVETLLSNEADVNLSGTENESPLMEACLRGYHEIVKLLLSAPNAKFNQKRRTDGATALYIACEQGAVECVKVLLTNDLLFVNEATTNGQSPIFIASLYGYTDIVKLLMDHSSKMAQQRFNHGVVDVNQCTSKGYTALWVAARNGYVQIVNLLLQNNANPQVTDSTGVTPLWLASCREHIEVLELLISHENTDLNHKTSNGTALWIASARNNAKVVELLLSSREIVIFGNDDESDLSDVSDSSDRQKLDKITKILNKNSKSQQRHSEKGKAANPNLRSHDGSTCLWIAASNGSVECMQLLIQYGADLNKSDKSQGTTPLFVACKYGKKAAVQILLSANADVNKSRSGDWTSPLMMASHDGHTEIVDSLLKSGADPIWANTTGLNAFACATMQGHIKVVELIYHHLLNTKNAQEIVDFVNVGDGVNGWTPLHLACMGGHEDVAKYLINTVRVDIFKKDYENKTGLEHAWENGHQNIVSWLAQLEHQYSRL